MFSFFKKLFGKAPRQTVAPLSGSVTPAEPSAPMPSVEVVHLSLAVIASAFPEELASSVLQLPEPEITVALPVPTIMKQLPTGVVKMSLASLHRQAPPGVFSPLQAGDRRMVNVPLGEIFLHISPSALKRRPDQRPAFIPDDHYNLFGNTTNPYEIAAPLMSDDAPNEEFVAVLDLDEAPLPQTEVSELKLEADPTMPVAPRVLAPPADYFGPTDRTPRKPDAVPAPSLNPPKPTKSDLPPIVLPLQRLAALWPEPIRRELEAVNGSATVALPAAEVGAALAKGKVSFTWGEICSWIEPAFTKPSTVNGDTLLLLPLKVVAPAFLSAAQKPKAEKVADLDETIPALFVNAHQGEPAPEAPAVEVLVPPAPLPETVPEVFTPGGAVVFNQEPPPEEIKQSEPAVTEPVLLTTLGAVFGVPERENWTPAELVSNVVRLPGVSGALVALDEGLPVAQSLPEELKAETIAAFLPQIFARLNHYSGEMSLGEVDELLFTSRGAPCQLYRLGQVYFAVLGNPDTALPTRELRLVADELAKHSAQA
jgi:predicted regulator of Ras-like GTPase activity (Roadblock/LC7/MglB family)